MKWFEHVRQLTNNRELITLESLRKLLTSAVSLPPHPLVEKSMAELQNLLTDMERFEEKAKLCLQAKYVFSPLLATIYQPIIPSMLRLPPSSSILMWSSRASYSFQFTFHNLSGHFISIHMEIMINEHTDQLAKKVVAIKSKLNKGINIIRHKFTHQERQLEEGQLQNKSYQNIKNRTELLNMTVA